MFALALSSTSLKELAHRQTAKWVHAEEALQASQQYARNIIESSLDMIIAVDNDRNIIEFNQAAQKVFGYTPEEVVGKHISILYADTENTLPIYQHTVGEGEFFGEILNKRKNGEIFPCLLSASILYDTHQDPIGLMGISRDITELKRAEQLREATPWGDGPRFLIRDNDDKYGDAFDRVADGSGIEVLPTPYQAPKANAICERFLGSVRRECLDFFLILSERHLYRTMKEYQAYFNHARPHQGINQQIRCPGEQSEQEATRGEIISRSVLGGLHHDYQRQAAVRPSLPRAA